MKISELIMKLQKLESEHGDIEVYETTDWDVVKYNDSYRPRVSKLHYQKWETAENMRDCLSDGNLEEADTELYDVDLTRAIIKAVII